MKRICRNCAGWDSHGGGSKCGWTLEAIDPDEDRSDCPGYAIESKSAEAEIERLRHLAEAEGFDPRRPRIVCLCGSTRFYREFQRANYEETMAGRIVLSVGFYMHSSLAAHGETWGCTPEQKEALDELHFRKIELADEVLVINVGGYVGWSTSREVAYAEALGKLIRWREPVEGSSGPDSGPKGLRNENAE